MKIEILRFSYLFLQFISCVSFFSPLCNLQLLQPANYLYDEYTKYVMPLQYLVVRDSNLSLLPSQFYHCNICKHKLWAIAESPQSNDQFDYFINIVIVPVLDVFTSCMKLCIAVK